MEIIFTELISKIRHLQGRGSAKILIIGHGNHGKDTIAKMISIITDQKQTSISDFIALKAVFPIVKDIYPNWKAAHSDRKNHRLLWFHAIRAYNLRPDTSLIDEILANHDICVGLRSRCEFEKVRHKFDLVIWVDRSRVIPDEFGGSMELNTEDADVVLDNNSQPAGNWSSQIP
ncbi:hypothetical protein [Pseudophaeobacter sp.]|uniref:hypothetical protein n=1 Tax=Pseudophaeobacter sp. TaxID=1971739 RepID=UPI003299B21F